MDLLHVGAWYSRSDDPMSVSYTISRPPQAIRPNWLIFQEAVPQFQASRLNHAAANPWGTRAMPMQAWLDESFKESHWNAERGARR